MDNMSNEQLLDNILGFMAYDEGCIDSGIHDEILKQHCRELVAERGNALEPVFRGLVHDWSHPESAYGIDDIRAFFNYLRNEFGWDI